jgi:hypothetical protein
VPFGELGDGLALQRPELLGVVEILGRVEQIVPGARAGVAL